MSFCTRIAEISWGANTPLNFLSVQISTQSWGTTIALSHPRKIETFLNSLGTGIFSVTTITNGIKITTLCNDNEFTQVTFTDSAGTHTASFADSDCSDIPCTQCETNCFEGLIGLRDVCSPSNACINLNELGLSRYALESFVTKDYQNAEDFFAKQYAHAVKEVSDAVHTNFNDKYITNSILESQRAGFAQDNLSVKSGNNKYSGIYLELLNSNSYLNLEAAELVLFTDYTGDIQVNVYDVITGKRIDVIVVPCVAGEESTVSLSKLYKSKRKGLKLFFAYDTTGINSYKTLIKNGLCCGKTTCTNQYVQSGGYYSNAGTFVKNDLKTSDHTFGMSIVYSLSCNHNDWICTHKNQLALSIAYRLAANIATFGLTASPSERINTKITINKEELEKSLSWYESKYSETLGNVLKTMAMPTDSKCFQCKATNKTVLNFP